MNNPAIEHAFEKLRVARDLILSTHVLLKDQGVNT
jgi:hypothetical protein